MARKFIRLIIASVLFLGSIFLFIKGFIFFGIMTVLISGIFVLSYFKNENIMLAFLFVRKNKLNEAAKALNRIKRPEQLVKSQEAYFYYLNGMIESQNRNISKAETNFKKALSIGLRMDMDQAVAKLSLAGICVTKRNKMMAQRYIQEAKKLDKQKMLTAQIREIETMMKKI